jgi:adenylate kinase
MTRLAGRWLCRKCGRSYHETFAPYGGEACEAGGTCELYQREDDRPEAVANRLDTYDAQTAPLIDYYRDRGLLVEIDGDRTPDAVTAQIDAAVPA